MKDIKQALAEYESLRQDFISLVGESARFSMDSDDYMCQYIHHSTAIEGNTLTLGETIDLLKYDKVSSYKSMRDHQEVTDLRDAYESMIRNVKNDVELVESTLLDYHKIVLRTTNPKEAGVFKKQNNYTRLSNGEIKFYPSPEVAPAMFSQAVTTLLNQKKQGRHPLVMASDIHLNIATAHPFTDGNGRLARLAFEHVAEQHQMPTLIFKKENKKDYIECLQKTQAESNPDVFAMFVIKNSIQFMKDEMDILLSNKKGLKR